MGYYKGDREVISELGSHVRSLKLGASMESFNGRKWRTISAQKQNITAANWWPKPSKTREKRGLFFLASNQSL